MHNAHIPKETPIKKYMANTSMGDQAKKHCLKYFVNGVLSKNLNDVAQVEIDVRNLHPKAKNGVIGQYLGYICNLLNKLAKAFEDKAPDGVTDEEHAKLMVALGPSSDVKKLAKKYNEKNIDLNEADKRRRAEGGSSEREKNADWEVITAKEKEHTTEVLKLMDKPLLVKADHDAIRSAHMLATLTRMPNVRSLMSLVKRRDFDPEKDNYISFSEEEYGQTVIVWNNRKGNQKRFNQVIPDDLARLLKRYVEKIVCVYHPDQPYLFPIEVKEVKKKDDDDEEVQLTEAAKAKKLAENRMKRFREIIANLNKKLLGQPLGESDMRRIQITYIGMPPVEADLARLALEFHHSANEHRLYFRNAHVAQNN